MIRIAVVEDEKIRRSCCRLICSDIHRKRIAV